MCLSEFLYGMIVGSVVTNLTWLIGQWRLKKDRERHSTLVK